MALAMKNTLKSMDLGLRSDIKEMKLDIAWLQRLFTGEILLIFL